jgi:predicted O-linked N-acetylglucosamine transferase (SPINDLY family)
VLGALPYVHRALTLQPDYVPALANHSVAAAMAGDARGAAGGYARLQMLQPAVGKWRLQQAHVLPVIAESREHIAQARRDYEAGLHACLEAAVDVPLGEIAQIPTAFWLSFHGLDNRNLQQLRAQSMVHACPALSHLASASARPREQRGRLRVGFLSRFLHQHSIGRTTRGLIAELSRERFEPIALFLPPLIDDEVSRFIQERAARSVVLPADLREAADRVASLDLDVLFYQDIGMEPMSYLLALSRLAPVQCVSFGHPETTGIPNVDWFISSDLFEPENAQAHYSERLHLIEGVGTLAYYYRPQLTGSAKTRAHFGLRDGDHLYLCPQTLFKVHPDLDAIFAEILRADPEGRVVLIEGKYASWGQLLRERFARTIPDVAGRIVFFPRVSPDDFLHLIAVCDVMLDTLHFNGMNTSLEAFSLGVPVVTLPGAFQRGRHTGGMYTRMGLDECIARSREDYVRIAVRLGRDTEYRAQVSTRILERCGALFEDRAVVKGFEDFFEMACAQAARADEQPGPAVEDPVLAEAWRTFHAGDLATARRKAIAASRRLGDRPEVLHLQGLIAANAGDAEQALVLLQRAALGAPDSAVLPLALAQVLLGTGDRDRALAHLRSAIALGAPVGEAQLLLGRIHAQRGERAQAASALALAASHGNASAEAWFELGVLHLQENAFAEAEVALRAACALAPRNARMCGNHGVALLGLGLLDEAAQAFRAAIATDPSFVEARANLGRALALLDDPGAEAQLRTALEASGGELTVAWRWLADLLANEGNATEAAACYDKVLARDDDPDSVLSRALLVPAIPESVEAMHAARATFRERLWDLLAGSVPAIANPQGPRVMMPFYLSYHGIDNRRLREDLGSVLLRACPDLGRTYPTARAPVAGRRLRVGLLSLFMRSHSIGRTTQGLVAELSRERFEVLALFLPPLVDDDVYRFIRERADRQVVLPAELAQARDLIAGLELDVLFFQDIGMEPMSYLLAFSRLAPVQCVSFGHPETTGIPNVDWFVSSDLFEPEGAQEHYSERLHCIEGVGTLAYYYRPRLTGPAKTRADFGLRDSDHLYLCPQTLFKVHPEIDALFGRILRADPRGRIVLIEASHRRWTDALRHRFATNLPDVAHRIVFVPRVSQEVFLHLISVCDVMLDTIHFNGMNTSLEALSLGTPVVTLPKALHRGRHTQGMYRRMGMADLVAADEHHYVQLALRLATDDAYRARMRAEILARCHVLYEDRRVVEGFERFFEMACGEAARKPDLAALPVLAPDLSALGQPGPLEHDASMFAASPALDLTPLVSIDVPAQVQPASGAAAPAASNVVPAAARFALEQVEAALARGDLAAAGTWCRKAVGMVPGDWTVHAACGDLLREAGHPEHALECFSAAARLEGATADVWLNLAHCREQLGQWGEAEQAYEHAAAAGAQADAQEGLGRARWSQGKVGAAREAFAEAVRLAPGSVAALVNLGNLCRMSGDVAQAIALYRRALALDGGIAEVHCNLAAALAETGDAAAALEACDHGLARAPGTAHLHNARGIALDKLGRPQEAVDAYRSALQLEPDALDPTCNLAALRCKRGEVAAALDILGAAARRAPDDARVLSLLGDARKAAGDPAAAARCYAAALERAPHDAIAGSNLLLSLNYTDDLAADHLVERHRVIAQQLYPHARTPGRRPHRTGGPLVVAYLSADFCDHPVATFIEPLLQSHDRRAFHVIGVHTDAARDATTQRLQSLADEWIHCPAASDEALAAQLRARGVDVLIELGGHTAGNRLGVLARRAAPVQITYLGYPTTTGVVNVDFRITDGVVDPDESAYLGSERLLRMPHSFLCAAALEGPAVQPPPSLTGRPLTFGSFNNNAKLSASTIALWSRVLLAIADSRLLLKSRSLDDAAVRARLGDLFAHHGVTADRLELRGATAATHAHLAQYADVDIALDPTPYNGTTTTVEALWMGVPVVTLTGARHASRVGTSILRTLGLTDCIARSNDEYVAICDRLAAGSGHLAHLRGCLRERMQGSALMDVPQFVTHFEDLLREACAQAQR